MPAPDLPVTARDREPERRVAQSGGAGTGHAAPAALGHAALGHAARRAALRAVLTDAGLDAMLVTDLINIRYLTGFTGSNAALLVVAADSDDPAASPHSATIPDHGLDRTTFCTDFRYLLQSSEQVPDLSRLIDRPCDTALVRRLAPGRIGFEAHVLTVDNHGELVRKAPAEVELVASTGLVERLRAVKDAGEVSSLRSACAIADAALAQLIGAGGIRPGRTEREVALDLDDRMRRLGSVDVSFPTILAAGENSAIPHHEPSDRPLATGDLVKIDFGAVVDGYRSDMTRTFALGAPADWQTELHALVAAAQRAGREAARAGAACREVDAAARDVITAAGYGEQFGHGLGHGVGLQVHEAPSLAATAAGSIVGDMTVTVEPGVYLPGRGGVRIEDSGVVGPDGYTTLTLSPRDLVVL